MKAVLFDLDNTLYPEIEFVKSGFRAVAHYLSSRHYLDREALVERMLGILDREGRGKIFDTLLRDLDMYSEETVRLLVFLYRSHCPTIPLYDETLPTLSLLREKGFRLGVITNGMASVQRSKVRALGIADLFNVIIYTDEIGRDYWKPSTVPYQIALNLLDVEPAEGIYVGNDLAKDFLGANTLGMSTIQLKRSMQREYMQNENTDLAKPKHTINRLNVCMPIIEEMRNA